MGKYTSGIDWSTVIAMTGAIEAMHACRVVWTVTTAGQAHNGGIVIACEAHFDVLAGSDLPKMVRVDHKWPTKVAGSFEGLWYNLLWQLDYAIQQAYDQLPLTTK